MGRIFLMRHGTVENPTDALYGRLPNYHLSEEGQEQAREAGQFLEQFPLSAVISSPLERAIETAHLATDNNSGQPKFFTDERITESNFGKYEGTNVHEFDGRREYYLERQLSGEDGMEHPQDNANRMMEAAKDWESKYPDKNILFVSHGDSIAFFLAQLTGADLIPAATQQYPQKAGIYVIDLAARKWENVFVPTNAKF